MEIKYTIIGSKGLSIEPLGIFVLKDIPVL